MISLWFFPDYQITVIFPNSNVRECTIYASTVGLNHTLWWICIFKKSKVINMQGHMRFEISKWLCCKLICVDMSPCLQSLTDSLITPVSGVPLDNFLCLFFFLLQSFPCIYTIITEWSANSIKILKTYFT